MFLKQNKQYYIFKTVLDNTLNFWFKRILTTVRKRFILKSVASLRAGDLGNILTQGLKNKK